jgi:dynein heavy chain 2
MEINAAGLLTVNYSERLVTLLREHRQLRELGYAVPAPIAQAAQDGEKYYRYGVTLKKVANFYNSMESQIIEAQKPMLLDALLAFEEVVTNPPGRKAGSKGDKTVTWSNPGECQAYVDRLLKAADRLSAENRKLRRAHGSLAVEVAGLMGVDLLRSREHWKAKWQGVRDLVAGLQAKFPPERMTKWVLHWDQQVYKAVESGYQMGLESLNENLGEIKVELQLSNKAVQFKPAYEEVRMIYYREMKKFLSIPTSFDGFGNQKLYRRMILNNGTSLMSVYQKAEELFIRLDAMRERYDRWTMLSAADLDVFVEENVREASGYEASFKAIRLYKKESEKLPDFEKVSVAGHFSDTD